MSDTDSDPAYPQLPVNLFDTPIEYHELVVPEGLSTPPPISPPSKLQK